MRAMEQRRRGRYIPATVVFFFQVGGIACAGGFLVPGDVSRPATHASQAQTAQHQQQAQEHVTQANTAGPAEQEEENTVWRELAEELRQIPQSPEESVQGMLEADARKGLLQSLRRAAGREEANAAAEERVRGSEAAATLKADLKAPARRRGSAGKQAKTQASGFDPHLMLSRLAQPVTKLTAKVPQKCFPKEMLSQHSQAQDCLAVLSQCCACCVGLSGNQHACCHVQEAAVVAELPLPPEMQRLEQIFQALNAVHSFLLSAHIQVGLPQATYQDPSIFCFVVLPNVYET